MSSNSIQNVFPIPHSKQTTTELTISLIFLCSSLSIITSFILMLFYFILFLQNKCKLSSSKTQVSINQSMLSSNNRPSIQSQAKKSQSKSSKNFGLGSHAMFFLNLTSCLWALISFLQTIFYPNGFVHKLDKYTTLCPLLGFLHNYFDLCIIGWSTTIIRLFLSSIKTAVLTPKEEKKELFFGLIFGFCVPLSITLLPFYSASYGPATFYCGLDLLNEKDKSVNMAWGIALLLFTFGCICYTIYATIKVVLFYKNKMVIVQRHNPREFGVLKRYVCIFVCFPIVLFVTRGLKLAHLALVWTEKSGTLIANIVNYVYAVSFSLNGFFNAMLCIFFFRKVCGCGNKASDNSLNISGTGSDMKIMAELAENINNDESEKSSRIEDE